MTAGHIYTVAGDRHGRVHRRRRAGHQRLLSTPTACWSMPRATW